MWARDMWPMIDKLGAVREFPSLLLSIWPVKGKYALPICFLHHVLFVSGFGGCAVWMAAEWGVSLLCRAFSGM